MCISFTARAVRSPSLLVVGKTQNTVSFVCVIDTRQSREQDMTPAVGINNKNIYLKKKKKKKNRKERKKDEDEEAKPTRHIGLILLHKAHSYSTVDEFDSLPLSLPGM